MQESPVAQVIGNYYFNPMLTTRIPAALKKSPALPAWIWAAVSFLTCRRQKAVPRGH